MDLKIPASDQADTPIRIKIVIPTNVYFLSGIRNFTIDMARNVAGFSEQWAHRFQTVVDELTNNAIEHGSREGDEIDLLFEIERQRSVAVTISDRGTGKDKTTAAEMEERVKKARAQAGQPTLDLRGRGFQIIANWTDEIAFTDNAYGGLTVRIKKTYSSTEIEAAIHAEKSKHVFVLEV